jgi:hypothetical protein
VASSFRWYQSLFGQAETTPAHEDFGQLVDSDGTVLLCLHEWGAHGHPSLRSPDDGTPGNGLILFFRVDDFDLVKTGEGWKIGGGVYTVESECEASPLGPLKE